jgi:hypothetical protein
MMTNECAVAFFRMLAVSCSSTMNVDCPAMMLSLAPATTEGYESSSEQRPEKERKQQTNSREYPIYRREAANRSRHVATHLRHDDAYARLSCEEI